MRSFQLLGIFFIVNQINAHARNAFPGEMTTDEQDNNMRGTFTNNDEETLDEINNGELLLQKIKFLLGAKSSVSYLNRFYKNQSFCINLIAFNFIKI